MHPRVSPASSWTVAVGTARVSGLIVKLLDSSPGTTDGETAPFELEKLQLPLVLTVAQLQLDDARLLRGEDTILVAIDYATLAGTAGCGCSNLTNSASTYRSCSSRN